LALETKINGEEASPGILQKQSADLTRLTSGYLQRELATMFVLPQKLPI